MTESLRPAHSPLACLALVLLALLAGCQKEPNLTLTLQLHGSAAAPTAAELAEARDTIERRLDQLGVSPAWVETSGNDKIRVRIPWEGDTKRLSSLLTTSAVFELRLARFPTSWPPPATREEVLAHYGGQLPPELEILPEAVRGEKGAATGKRYYAVERKAVLTGGDLRSVRPGLGQYGQHTVNFEVKPEPAKAFAQATGDNVGAFLAIVLDGHVVSAPKINSRIGEQGVIEGGFTAQEAEDLATVLRSGPLPGRLTLTEMRVR